MAITAQLPLQNRRLVRAPINASDKSTIVSIHPREIVEIKPTLSPGRWVIPAGSYEKPSTLVVGPSSWFRDLDEESPILEIPHSSVQIAESIVKDYLVGILECDMNERMPGLFFIPGEVSVEDVKKNYKHKLEHANKTQKAWYLRLCQVADSLWAQTNGNPLSISNDMRLAATDLGLNKAWMQDYQAVALVKCFACGSLRDTNYPICPSCKVIDPNHPKAKELQFVK